MIYRKLVSEDTGFSKLFSFAMLELAKVQRRGALSPATQNDYCS